MRRFLLLSLCLIAASANAQAPARLDYITMTKQLRSYGIDPAFVGWAEIQPLCTGFMSYNDDQTDYNRCLFDKAVLQTSWRGDSDVCDNEAAALYPDSLRTNPKLLITSASQNGGTTTGNTTSIYTPVPTRSELTRSRVATYDHCMSDKGWRNPRDWRLGFAQ